MTKAIFLAVAVYAQYDTPPDTSVLAARIIRANRDYESSLASLHVEYLTKGGDFAFKPANGRPIPRELDCRWTYARSGRREVLFSALEDYHRNSARNWAAFDGSRGTTLSFAVSDPQLVDRMDLASGQRPLEVEHALIPRTLGWSCHGFGSIVALMEKADHRDITHEPARFWLGKNEQQVFPGVKWVLKRFRDRADWPEHELAVWFSEPHGWLPRAIQVQPLGTFPKNKDGVIVLPEGCRVHQLAVLDYMTVNDPVMQKPRFFPQKICDFMLRWRITEVNTVSVNEGIPGELFEPTATAGAMIVREPGTPREQREFVGGDDGERLHRELTEKNREFLGRPKPVPAGPVTANLALINAKPESLRWPVGRFIFYGSVILLLAAAGTRVFTRWKSASL